MRFMTSPLAISNLRLLFTHKNKAAINPMKPNIAYHDICFPNISIYLPVSK